MRESAMRSEEHSELLLSKYLAPLDIYKRIFGTTESQNSLSTPPSVSWARSCPGPINIASIQGLSVNECPRTTPRASGYSRLSMTNTSTNDRSSFITKEELKKHNRREDVWIAIEGKVYDVTKWAMLHPGGDYPILTLAGQDVTGVWNAHHLVPGCNAENILKTFKPVGLLLPEEETELAKSFRSFNAQLLKNGLYETSLAYYVGLSLWIALLGLSATYCTMAANSVASTVLAGVLYGLFQHQNVFFAHDAAHHAVTFNRRVDWLLSFISGNLLGGVSIEWWNHTHNVHHVVTNSLSHDPDVQHMPFMAVDTKQWAHGGQWSAYHQKFFKFDSVAKLVISYQHYLFYPLMAVARWNIYAQCWTFLLDFTKTFDNRETEIVGLLLHHGSLLWLVSHLPSFHLMVVFLLVAHAMFLTVHIQIAISHWSLPMYEGPEVDAKPGEEFLMRMLEHVCDTDSAWYNDWLYGGLQWQVVHHLFPRLPRHNLPTVKKQFQDFCKEHGLVYNSVSWWTGNMRSIRHLRDMAMKARHSKTVSFLDSELWSVMKAEG